MIRCASVSSYMGPYISNYILSELALERVFRQKGDYLIHIFPKEVEDKVWGQLFKDMNAKVYYIDYHPRTVKSIRTLRGIFRKEKVNIIHCHFGGWDFDAKIAAPFTPMVWHQRMYVKYWLKYNILGMFKTVNIAISDAVYDAICSITGKTTYNIPNCIDFDRVTIDLPRRIDSTLYQNPCKILLFGYSPYVKGLDIAYQACELLIDQGYRIELDVVSQPVSDEYIRDNYTPIPSWFSVLKPSSTVSDYYNQSGIFLSASRSEGFSNSLLEAIYCGCPAVYSDIPGTSWAKDFSHTYRYSVESPASLCEAIKKCMSEPITKEVIMDNRRLATEKYSMDSWAEKVYKVLTVHHKD